jgi:hypothetical protein
MTIMLDLETSVAYLEGSWAALAIELDVLEDLRRRNVTEPTAVVLCDGMVAFYCAKGEVL